jgi:hypothetical protein
MEVKLGKAQTVKAIDDGGMSIFFRRYPESDQISQRVILSVEVFPSVPDPDLYLAARVILIVGEKEET